MAKEWIAITRDFDRSLSFTKVRWDFSKSWYDGYFSELPNINCDGKGWTSITGAEWGYAGQYTMNLSSKACYIRDRENDSYSQYNMNNICTQVPGTNLYEYEYSGPLYWGGFSTDSLYEGAANNGIFVYVDSGSISVDTEEIAADSASSSYTISVSAETGVTWTASTNDSWISLAPTTGEGNGSIIVLVAEAGYTARTGEITITSSEGDSISVSVSQAKKPLILTRKDMYQGENLINKMYKNEEVIYQRIYVPEPVYSAMPLTFEIISGGTIVWKAVDAALVHTISYSKNDGEWTDITSTTEGVEIPVVAGDKVRFKGYNSTYGDGGYNSTFSGTTAPFEAYGNIMSLIDGNTFKYLTTLEGSHNFKSLFAYASIVNAHNLILPATTLVSNCYSNMFHYCTGLTSAPELPATTLATYCYRSMFNECSSLATAPVLPATTLDTYCYSYMFKGTAITQAPALPATTLQTGCYNYMFQNCTGLTAAPDLLAPTLVANCYRSMFYGCSNLSYIKCLATNPGTGTGTWTYGVAATGTFVLDATTASYWFNGYDGIPIGWQEVIA